MKTVGLVALLAGLSPAVTRTVLLEWNAVKGARMYDVLRCQGSGCTPETAINPHPVTGLAYADSTAYVGNVYRYKVVAVGPVCDGDETVCGTSAAETSSITIQPAAPVIAQIILPILGGGRKPGTPTAPVITSTSPLPAGTINAAYSFQFAATGSGPITWTATGVPAGLMLSTSGLLSGTPTVTATSTINVTAMNSVGSAGPSAFSLTVGAGTVPVITSSSPLPGGSVNSPYSFQFAASGTTPITWSATGVPAGLMLSASGLLNGTPTAAATSTINVTATNSAGNSGPVAFSLTVSLAATFTAATCNQPDVNAVINGPIHTAVDGDIIQIPAGSCAWNTNAGIIVPPTIGITIRGTGTPNASPATVGASSSCTQTTITFTVGNGFNFIFASPAVGNSTTRISCMQIITTGTGTGTTRGPLIMVSGTCSPSGCPNFRADNLTVPTAQICLLSGAAVTVPTNVFGVNDHNTIGDVPGTGCFGPTFAQINHSVWQGMSAFGDFSWASSASVGTNQAFFLENNLFSNAIGTDQEASPGYTLLGGARGVCRFNTFNNITGGGACTNHGTDTTGRRRGGRQGEFYGNNVQCTNTNGCSNAFGYRAGVGRVFGNVYSIGSGSFFTARVGMSTQRAYRAVGFGYCNGTNPFDINDGAATVFTGSVANVGSGTITVNGSPFVPDQFDFNPAAPGMNYYAIYDSTSGQFAGIASNTLDTLTTSWKLSNLTGIFGGTGADFAVGDTITITSSKLYDAGTHTGANGVTTLTDASKAWMPAQWVSLGHAFSVIDVANGVSFQIASNTATTATPRIVPNNTSLGAFSWTNGDPYAITSATQCLDQPAISAGADFMGAATPSIFPNSQTLDATYSWNNSGTAGNQGEISADSLNIIVNRNFYIPVSPFTGATGIGSGPLASMPATCTPQVAWWATDQGSWNQSGNSFGQGVLYICTAPNTWTPSYTPFTYPHPLDR